MTQKEKELLLKDLCARLPYGIKVHVINDTFYDIREPYDININYSNFNLFTGNKLIIKPYLRPISSMTDEEAETYTYLWNRQDEFSTDLDIQFKVDLFDWLNKNHFDYRGLIEKGLALEALEEMYK